MHSYNPSAFDASALKTASARKLYTRKGAVQDGAQSWKYFLLTFVCAVIGITFSFRERPFHATSGANIEMNLAKQWKELTAEWQPSSDCDVASLSQPALSAEVVRRIGSGLGGTSFLVFDAGVDTSFWLAKNCKGRTTFIEDSRASFEKQPKDVQEVTKVMQRPRGMTSVDDKKTLSWLFQATFTHELMVHHWDQILIEHQTDDARAGLPLIMYAANKLAGSTTTIFVNGCGDNAREEQVKKWLLQDGRKFSRFSNEQGGSVCMLEPVVKGATAAQPHKRSREVSPAAAIAVVLCLVAYALVLVPMRIRAIKSIPTPTWQEVNNTKNQQAWQHQYRHRQELQRRCTSLTRA